MNPTAVEVKFIGYQHKHSHRRHICHR